MLTAPAGISAGRPRISSIVPVPAAFSAGVSRSRKLPAPGAGITEGGGGVHPAVKALCALAGGLGMFLMGMDIMSGSLRDAAGDRLRRSLAACAKSPLTGALAGAAATGLLQSSSAVTVMAVGFVSADLMDLPSAMAVIFGANVGTTVTAQLLAFRLGDWAGALLLAGFALWQLAKSAPLRAGGRALAGFGLLLAGVEAMGRAMGPLAEGPRFAGLMARAADTPLLGLTLGASLTAAVQSSSAAVAILQSVAVRSGLDLAGALPLLLGCNIGTTVTAVIAAAGRSRDAKRAALAHAFFNLSGALIVLPFASGFASFAEALSPAGTDALARQIANAHTLFNVLCTALWLPLLPVMEKLVRAILPDKR